MIERRTGTVETRQSPAAAAFAQFPASPAKYG
jgi:hypothetical protein